MKLRQRLTSLLVLYIGLVAMTAVPVSAKAADSTHASPGADDETIKVVWHADFADPRRFSAMLTSVFNMVNTFDQDLQDHDVRIIFNAHGIRFVTNDKLEGTPFEEDKAMRERRTDLMNRLRTLQETYNVKLELCDITRTQINLDRKKIIPGVDSVTSGVGQVAKLQRQGFAYLKAE